MKKFQESHNPYAVFPLFASKSSLLTGMHFTIVKVGLSNKIFNRIIATLLGVTLDILLIENPIINFCNLHLIAQQAIIKL